MVLCQNATINPVFTTYMEVNLYNFSSREMQTKKGEFRMTLECEWKKTRPGQSSVPLTELKSMLDQVGLNLPTSKVMALTEELKCSNRTNGNNLSKQEFLQVS